MVNNKTLIVVVLLSISVAGSQTKGNQDTASSPHKDTALNQLTVFKERTFILGSDVTLWCGNTTDIKWSEMIYIVWNISLQDRKCWLGLSPMLDDTCEDGKRLYNDTSNAVSLLIPNITIQDEGFYYCDVSYKGGSYAVNVSVSVTQLSTHLDSENNQRIAVCRAIYKKTAPSLHWEPALNLSSNISSVEKLGRFFMENRVYLPDHVSTGEITCVSTYPSESGSVRYKSTLDLKLKTTFCLRMKEETPTEKYGG
ncbi:uncharacterized protein LOC122332243 isoform X3 [Puntigrus tetrazona]|uniref:uncharacterized protein LOC122332243 isoform X3 n=1 Tax=Puntigrus tetrazona TaxID=1606681 RepID=UPI001C89E58B|nr:uncharacterized protein LOC122332243 isoform X3 [Puntigrus tetrazona]